MGTNVRYVDVAAEGSDEAWLTRGTHDLVMQSEEFRRRLHARVANMPCGSAPSRLTGVSLAELLWRP